jgi:hypothetical protein
MLRKRVTWNKFSKYSNNLTTNQYKKSVSLQNIVQQDITTLSTVYDLGRQLRKVKSFLRLFS